MSYEIPKSLASEIDDLELMIGKHLGGELDAAALKARRVPFGCYEQRKDGTYMLRIRCTGGDITPRQLETIARLSAHYGGEAIQITTRQEFQIHDLALENVIPVMRQLFAAGLSTRGGGGNTVRNIMVSPDAGTSADEVFDPSPYAFALTSRLIAEPGSWLLPRKFKIVFSNSARDTAYAQFNDLGFIASVKNGVRGFKVYIAGGMGSEPEVGHLLYEFIPDTDVYLVAEATKHLLDKYGNRKNKYVARLRFMWRQLGEQRFRELYEQELTQLRAAHPEPLKLPASIPAKATVSLAPVQDDSEEFRLWKQRYVESQQQPGLYSVLIPVLFGTLKNQEATTLAQFLLPFGDDVLRATLGQNLRLRNIPEAYLGSVYAAVKNLSELASAPPLLANSIACTGANTCRLGICLSRGALQQAARMLANPGLDLDQLADFKLNFSGCPNTCAQHMLADLGFYGRVGRKGQQMYPAYGIVAGAVRDDGQARLAQSFATISARDLPAFLCDLFRMYLPKKSRFASFAAYIDAEGGSDLHALCERYRDVPDFEEDKNYYFDWGASEVFSLADRGAGECSAGLFDLIEVDLRQIKKTQQELAAGLPLEKQGEALYQIALCASRMLLITRGVEAHSDEAVFEDFSKHFIASGLVDARFWQVVDAARTKNTAKLRQLTTEVTGLAEAVEKLYTNMDNSLHFPAEHVSAPPEGSASVRVAQMERDYRTVGCPMNFVKVKLDLARMQKGQILKVLLDDGPPIENVPRSVAAEGHRVLQQKKTGDHWSVLIERA
jgi:sulfite reductase (ferredoxin)